MCPTRHHPNHIHNHHHHHHQQHNSGFGKNGARNRVKPTKANSRIEPDQKDAAEDVVAEDKEDLEQQQQQQNVIVGEAKSSSSKGFFEHFCQVNACFPNLMMQWVACNADCNNHDFSPYVT